MCTLTLCVSSRRRCPLVYCVAACLLGVASASGIAATTICPADMTADSRVNGTDLGMLLGSWGSSDATADLDADGIVDGADLGILLGSWGICSQVPASVNIAPVQELLLGLASETARIFIIGDSQSAMSDARLFASMIRTWEPVLDFAALPYPPGVAAPFSIGFSSIAGTGVTETKINPGATFTSGLIGRITQAEEFRVSNIGSNAPIAHVEMRQNSDLNQKWLNTPLQARLVYEDGGAGMVSSFKFQITRGAQSSGMQTVLTNAGGYGLVLDQIGPSIQNRTRISILADGAVSNQSFIVHGGLFVETSGGLPVTSRPWLMGNIFMAGSKLSEWANGALRTDPGTFEWTDLGNLYDALATSPSEWPNLIMINFGHNDGPTSPPAASYLSNFTSIVTSIDSEYISRGIAPPRYLLTQLWCTDTIDNDYWKTVWVDGWMPIATGRVCVASVAALHNFETYNGIERIPDRLDNGNVHAATPDDADFFFGSQGLLGILLGTQP
jgi:hypothetical protein